MMRITRVDNRSLEYKIVAESVDLIIYNSFIIDM